MDIVKKLRVQAEHDLLHRPLLNPNLIAILIAVLTVMTGMVSQPGDAAPPWWHSEAGVAAGWILVIGAVRIFGTVMARGAKLSAYLWSLLAVQTVIVFLAYRVYFVIFRVEMLAAFIFGMALVPFLIARSRVITITLIRAYLRKRRYEKQAIKPLAGLNCVQESRNA